MDTPDEHADAAPADLPPTEYPPPPMASTKARRFTIGSFVCAVLALVLYPIVFGPLGVVLAIYGKRNGDPLAQKALIASIVTMVVGLALAAFLVASDDNALAALAA